jgi:hypothetical protein
MDEMFSHTLREPQWPSQLCDSVDAGRKVHSGKEVHPRRQGLCVLPLVREEPEQGKAPVRLHSNENLLPAQMYGFSEEGCPVPQQRGMT